MREKILSNLSSESEKKIETMVLEKPIRAIEELRNLTGCSIMDGKNGLMRGGKKFGKKIYRLVHIAARNCELMLQNNAIFAHAISTMKII